MKHLSLFIILFFSINSISQEAYSIKLDSLFLETKAQSLDFYIEDVIDNRLYNEYIGIAQVGFYNYPVPLKFENSLKFELGNFFKRIFPNKDSGHPVTIRINEFVIKESPKVFVEVGEVIIRFDILRKELDGNYTILNSYSVEKTRNTFDATQGNFGRLFTALGEVVLLVANNTDYNKEGKILNLEYNPKPPILFENPKKGFYLTYSELARNISKTDLEFTIKEKSKNKGSTLITIESTDDLANECFAYFDGQNYFLNSSFYNNSNYFIKTLRVDNFLLFTEDFIADDFISAFTIAKGRSGYDYVKTRRPIIFSLDDGYFYVLRRNKMAQLLESSNPDLFKRFKKNEKKDIGETYEILKFIFENQDPEKVREIL